MLAALLALGASVGWGVWDFVGGLLSRRYSAPAVAFLANSVGVAVLAVVVLAWDIALDRDAVGVGLAAGLFGGVSAFTFYQALALGRMSVASPLLACGAVIAFAIAVAAGERPSLLAFVGTPVAVAGVVLVSLEEHTSGGIRRTALAFALVAPVALGAYLYLLGWASDLGGSIPATLAARFSSIFVLLALVLYVRPSLRLGARGFGLVSLVGLGTTGALVLFAYAADLGLISIAAILASLYPIVTVLLAYVYTGERLRPVQLAGASFALTGAGLITAG
jgi:drug/metabolite transporter (DMT)-like permease